MSDLESDEYRESESYHNEQLVKEYSRNPDVISLIALDPPPEIIEAVMHRINRYKKKGIGLSVRFVVDERSEEVKPDEISNLAKSI